MPKKAAKTIKQSWGQQSAALAVLLVLGSLAAYMAPGWSGSPGSVFDKIDSVSFNQIAALALTASATIIFLAYLRAKLYFSTRWLVAAVAYNFLVLFVKFTLSANELSGKGQQDFASILSTALLVSLLYISAFSILYLFFDGRLLNKKLHKALIVSAEGKVLLAMGLFICATLARIVVFRLPGLSDTSASSYLGDIFEANTALLSGLLFVMIIAAVEAFAQVRRRADLKYFFVSGIALVLFYHLWWAIFIYRSY